MTDLPAAEEFFQYTKEEIIDGEKIVLGSFDGIHWTKAHGFLDQFMAGDEEND